MQRSLNSVEVPCGLLASKGTAVSTFCNDKYVCAYFPPGSFLARRHGDHTGGML